MISAPLRWRDWASNENKGTTDEELLKFVNNELLPGLRGLSGSDERLKIAELFKETYNRMLSGYLPCDVSIFDALEQLPERYSQELYSQKCEQVYQHVYESYFGAGQSIYSVAG